MMNVLTAFPAAAFAEHYPCAPFDKLALKKLPETIDPDSTVRMQDLWGEWSRKANGALWPLTAGAEPQFRIETSETFVPKPHAYEIRGIREGQVWSLQARKKLSGIGTTNGAPGAASL
jgi:hypothetical protein